MESNNAQQQIIELREEVTKQILPIVEEAAGIAAHIHDDFTFQTAGAYLIKIKGARKYIEEKFGPLVHKAHEAWKASLSLQKEADAPLNKAEAIIKPAMLRYQMEQETIRREAEAEARKAAAKIEEEARLARAAELEKQGQNAAAEAVLEKPAFVPTVVLPDTQKVAGVSFRELWQFEVVDFMALVKAVAAGTVPTSALCPNEKVIGQMARSLKSDLQWPGVKAFATKSVAAGAR